MFDFDLANQQISLKGPLIDEISKLIAFILDQKKFNFTKEELDFEPIELQKNKIVGLTENSITLLESNFFYYSFYLEFSKRKSFVISGDLKALLDFLQSIKGLFELVYTPGASQFSKGVNTIVLFLQHQLFEVDILHYTKTWTNEQGSPLYIFTEAFSNFLPYQKFEPKKLLEILRELFTLHEFDKPDITKASVMSSID